MITIDVFPVSGCRVCHGTGEYSEGRPWGSTVAYERMSCECFDEQLTEEQLAQLDSGLAQINIVVADDPRENMCEAEAY